MHSLSARRRKIFFFFFFLTSNMENLSQLVTQEDYLGLQVLRITHHCYVLALNRRRKTVCASLGKVPGRVNRHT
jgi:hypothetical protein